MKDSQEELRKRLTPEQYRVTQQHGTEKPFTNEYWNCDEPGIYVDIVSGEPLFSSLDKFAKGSGWPSFYRCLEPDNIVIGKNQKYWMTRNEVRSRLSDSHLGHVFEMKDSPTGQYYCINSSSLRFIPVKQLKDSGYERYESLFTSFRSDV